MCVASFIGSWGETLGKCNLWRFVKPDQCQIHIELAEKGIYYCLIRKIKNTVVILAVLGIPGYILYNQFNVSINETLNRILYGHNYWGIQMLLGIFLYIILAWLVHFIAFNAISSKKPSECTDLFLFYILLSPDFYFAKMYKTNFNTDGKDKVEKANFIQCSNWLNIFTTILLGAIFVRCTKLPILVLTIFVYRLISRCSEITYAFYKDIVDEKGKTSSLKRGERISLAIHSFFEVIILYAFIYYWLFGRSMGVDQFISSLIFSTRVSTFTFELSCNELLFKYIVITQVIVSLNLVVLSLANYLGTSDKKDETDQ